VAIGLALVAVGVVTVWIPFTLHSGGVFVVAGLIMVLRNSRRGRRRFIVWSRRHPRWGVPLRRLLRREPQVWPVLWHELLRFERWILPHHLRALRPLRRRIRGRRR
jgi:hypothetical protein